MKSRAIKVLVPVNDRIVSCSGIGIIKSLSLSQIQSTVFCVAPNPYSARLYMAHQSALCPDLQNPEYMRWIIGYCKRNQIDIILPDATDFQRFAQNREVIYQACGSVVLAHPDPVIILTENKLATSVWLQKNNLPHPRFAPANDDAAVDRLVDTVGFPLIAKPCFGKGSEGVTLVGDEIGLSHARQRPDMLFQEYVGEDDSEYTVCCFIDREGLLQGSLVLRRKLWHGVSVYCEVDRNEGVLSASEKIANRLGGRGSLNIQLRIHKGMAVCLEINARFSGTAGIRAHLGFNDVEFSLRHYFFNQPCGRLPVIREGLALRYFDEVYPSNLPSSEPVPG